MAKRTITAEELDEKLKADGIGQIKSANGKHPPVGDVWADQIAGAGVDDEDDDDDAEAVDRAASSILETATAPENADAFDDAPATDLTYERTADDSERQTVQDFPAIEVMCQLQNVSYRPRSNGLGIFLQFDTGLEVAASIAKVKGADLLFAKLLLGHGATMVSVTSRADADGNLRTKINIQLPESELMRADPRPLILKTATLRLEPAQLQFDLTTRAE